MRFVIGTDGNISQPSVDKSSGNADLDQAALACVTQWHYIAARQNGVPVAVPWVAKVIWNPDEAEAPKSCADFYAGPPVAFDQIDGTTEIKAQISRGVIARVTVESSSGNKELDYAALKCVATWATHPGTYGANAVVRWKELLAKPK